MKSIREVKDRGLENVWFGIEGTREYWTLAKGIETLGIKKFLFGSDYPIEHPRIYLGLVEALQLSSADRDLILGGNLSGLLDPEKCLFKGT